MFHDIAIKPVSSNPHPNQLVNGCSSLPSLASQVLTHIKADFMTSFMTADVSFQMSPWYFATCHPLQPRSMFFHSKVLKHPSDHWCFSKSTAQDIPKTCPMMLFFSKFKSLKIIPKLSQSPPRFQGSFPQLQGPDGPELPNLVFS